jgi:HEAT repeat protein
MLKRQLLTKLFNTMMKLKFPVLCAALALVPFGLFDWNSSEPAYGGHRLSYWVRQTDYVPLFELNMHGEGGFTERDQAFRALAAIGAPAVPALCQMVENTALKWDRRWRAVQTLGEIGPPAKAASPSFVKALADPTFPEHERYSLVMALVAIGAAGECATDLTNFLKQRYTAVPLADSSATGLDQFQTIAALGQAGAAAQCAVPLLLEMLRAYQAALKQPETAALPARPEERKWAEKSRETLRRALVDALGQLGTRDPSVPPAVMDSRNDPAAGVRLRVAVALIQLGKQADALPLLDELAGDPDLGIRRQLIETLGSLAGQHSAASLPRLISMLGDTADEMRWLAAKKLGDMGSAAKPALSALKALAKDKSVHVREVAREAVGKIERSAEKR